MIEIVRYFVTALAVCVTLTGCGGHSPAGNERHYQLTGRIIALNSKDHTATIDAATIPNFMEAMTMDYPVKSRVEFEKLHVGDKIKATVNVRDEGYDLSNIQEENAGK